MELPLRVQPDISVCTWVNKKPLKARPLLHSLEQTADPVEVEAFLVNAGGGNDDDLLREFTGLKIFSLPQESEQRAVNQAMELATGRYILPVDHDVLLQPECLLNLVEFMDDNPDTGIAAPCVLNAYGKPEHTVRAFPGIFSLLTYGLLRNFSDHDCQFLSLPQNNSTEVDWLWSGVRIIRRELVEDIGLPDSDILPYIADMDYALRARQAGWHTFYVPAATVIHPNPLKYDTCLTNIPFSLSAAMKFMKKKWLR